MTPVAKLRLAELLEEKREKEHRRIPMAAVARYCGVTRQQMWRWFHNQINSVSLQIIAQLCIYFDCTPNDLIAVKRERAS